MSSLEEYRELEPPGLIRLSTREKRNTYIIGKELDGSNVTLSTIQTILIDIVHLWRHADDREVIWLAERMSFWNDNTLPWTQ
jgi:hypothetical protein